MAKHKRSTIWTLRRNLKSHVRTASQRDIELFIHQDEIIKSMSNTQGVGVVVTRTTARLLARRINECLESTK